MKNKPWYKIEAKAKKKAEILIYEQIGQSWDGAGVSAKEFVKELMDLDVQEIDVHINSPGGNVFEGISIYNALKSHPAVITVYVDGVAASIASVIAMAGDTIEMPENAMMMIHDPRALVVGTADDMKSMAEALDKMKAGLVSAYHDKSEMDREKIGELMTAETWLTAAEAVEHGLADKVTDRVKIQACACPEFAGKFKTFPSQFITAGISGHKLNKEEVKMEITLAMLEEKHPDIVAQIQKKGFAVISVDFLNANHPEVVAALAVAAAKTERDRIQEIQSHLIPGHEALIQALMFDGVTTGAEAAVKILQAEQKLRVDTATNLDTDAAAGAAAHVATDDAADAAAAAAAAGAADDEAPLEDRAKAIWKKDKAIRDEFLNKFDAFFAYLKADEAGQIRILGAEAKK